MDELDTLISRLLAYAKPADDTVISIDVPPQFTSRALLSYLLQTAAEPSLAQAAAAFAEARNSGADKERAVEAAILAGVLNEAVLTILRRALLHEGLEVKGL